MTPKADDDDAAGNSLTKWVVGVVATALVTALAFFITADRTYVGNEIKSHSDFAVATDRALALHEYRLAQAEAANRRIEEKLDAILDRLPTKKPKE
jgi:hypothetical protein